MRYLCSAVMASSAGRIASACWHRKLARGQTVNQIAETLTLSASTVGTHLYNIKQKLNVVNQAELTLIAVRHKLIEA